MADPNGSSQPPPESKRPGGPNMRMSRNVVSWLILLGLAMLLVAVLSSSLAPTPALSITEFQKLVAEQLVPCLSNVAQLSRLWGGCYSLKRQWQCRISLWYQLRWNLESVGTVPMVMGPLCPSVRMLAVWYRQLSL